MKTINRKHFYILNSRRSREKTEGQKMCSNNRCVRIYQMFIVDLVG